MILGCGVVLGVVLLVVPLSFGESSAGGRALRDALHFPFFVVLLGLVHALLLRLRPAAGTRGLLLAMLLTAAIGGASEWAQTLSSRTASWRDFSVNLLGIGAGAAAIAAVRLRGSRRFLPGLLAAAAVWTAGLSVVARPWRAAIQAEQRQAAAFPLLGDFEHQWEALVWVPQGTGEGRETTAAFSDSHPTRGRRSLKVEARGCGWAGVRVLFGNPLPWPAGRTLCFDVFNPGVGFDLGIRVDGFDGSRYRGQVPIAPGQNRRRVTPGELRNGAQDLTQPKSFAAKTIVFHLGESPSTASFHLDHVRLE